MGLPNPFGDVLVLLALQRNLGTGTDDHEHFADFRASWDSGANHGNELWDYTGKQHSFTQWDQRSSGDLEQHIDRCGCTNWGDIRFVFRHCGRSDANSSTFSVTGLPLGWTDGDIGSVGVAGSATYANGTFTVKGAGLAIDYGTVSDAFNFVFQPLSGDSTLVARVVSLTGGSQNESAGVIIRETLNPNATSAYLSFWPMASNISFWYRPSTGATGAGVGGLSSVSMPYWIKLVRTGSTFSSYAASDGINWVQLGNNLTIDMAQAVYVGLGVTSNTTSALATATFDNVSVSSNATPGPVITGVSNTSGPVSSQVLISGTGFGSAGVVMLNGVLTAVNSWSSTSISITIPSTATSGSLVVSVSPSMNASNPVYFSVTTQPLPNGWLDQDVGQVGAQGSATYANGVFTVNGAGPGTYSGLASDGIHFVYLPLSGDGAIVARVASLTGGSSYKSAGVMIRETLNPMATNGQSFVWPAYSESAFSYRTSTGSGDSIEGSQSSVNPPYWVKVVRSEGTFTGYGSTDGVNWVQLGTSQPINMGQNVFAGLAVTSNSSSLATATFDNVSVTSAANPGPVISSISATNGAVGNQVTITGSGFGATQGNSLVTLNAVPTTINSWSDSSITFTIPSGATTGYLVVSVAPSMICSNPVYFVVTTQPLPSGWLDQDIGILGAHGSATYANGVFTVKGAGPGTYSGLSSDGLHFVYLPLAGDGTILARVTSLTGATGSGTVGVMIRETLSSVATDAQSDFGYAYSEPIFCYRTTTGTGVTLGGSLNAITLPYWMKLVRSGNTFASYAAPDGVNWVQMGTTQTITMAQNIFVGLALSGGSNTTLATATFDNVSVSSTASPGPVIQSMSATTGSIGNQVTILGSGFGAAQGSSLVTVNAAAMTINYWSDSSITFTIPSGASTGYLVVSVAPSMNDSNAVFFTIETQALPSGWLDQDIGTVGVVGSASYTNGAFTIQGSGTGIWSTADQLHFVYQPLAGDATIVARVASLTDPSGSAQAGVMVRETLNSSSKNVFVGYSHSYAEVGFDDRTSTGGTTSTLADVSATLPYWVKLVRSGNIFSAYASSNGTSWTQLGTSQTVTMATNVYIGLAVSLDYYRNAALATATLDNISLTAGLMPLVTSLAPVAGPVGTSVNVNGTSFGATQGTSTITFNGTPPASITSWSNTQIVAVVPSTIRTGPVVVTVNNVASNSDVVFTAYNPVLSSLSPPAAPANGLGIISVNGYGFGPIQGSSTVKFNGVTGIALAWSDTAILVNVPSSATTGPVTVTMNGVTSNGVQFTLIEPLTVTGISPSSGAVNSSVTISGTGFGPAQSNSVVTFNGTTANATSWSDTSITATVPSGASTGPVTVEVANTTVLGPSFEVTASATLTDSLGDQTTYWSAMVGGRWYVSSEQGSGCSSCTERGTIQNQFDNYGNVIARTDELGRTTNSSYDSNGNVTSITQPTVGGTSPVTTYTYNGFGEVLTMTDPLGNVTHNSYDSHGNLLSVILPGPTDIYAAKRHSVCLRFQRRVDPDHRPAWKNHNDDLHIAGLIKTITDAQQNTTSYGYDLRGNRTAIVDALQHRTAFATIPATGSQDHLPGWHHSCIQLRLSWSTDGSNGPEWQDHHIRIRRCGSSDLRNGFCEEHHAIRLRHGEQSPEHYGRNGAHNVLCLRCVRPGYTNNIPVLTGMKATHMMPSAISPARPIARVRRFPTSTMH